MQRFAQISDPHLSSLEGVPARDLMSKRALGYLSWRLRRRFEHRTEVLAALERDLMSKRALGYLSWRLRRRFEHRSEVLAALERDLQQFALDQLLVTGDLTHLGLPREFRQALAWLRQLGEPREVAVIPGNHDASVATPWRDTFALWRDYMASDMPTGLPDSLSSLYPSLRSRGNIAFIGLSTACPKPPFMATGTAGAAQLARLPALLDDAHAGGQFRVIYIHHSPLPGKDKWRKRLTDANRVQDIIAGHGAELVLHGHGHRAQHDELATVHGSAPVIAVPSASALGLHGGSVASYNCYSVERCDGGWRLAIESRDYLRASGEFTAGESRSVMLARAAWEAVGPGRS